MTTPVDADLERLIDFVKTDRGFDFSGYKRATLGRRVHKRMADVGIDDIGTYIDQLQAAPDEFAALFDTILINVSSFFREPQVWDHLARRVIPEIIAAKAPDAPIRVWSAGCASGEEPYTVAMLLAEALGLGAYRERVKVFATDIDEDALSQARQALYDADKLGCVPAGLRERWFAPADGGRLRVDADLRRSVIFGRNDLLRDAPISKLDLLLCRNTLIYFNAEAQADVVGRFRLALNDGGHVVLGKSELMLAHGGAFLPEEPSLRIFRKASGYDRHRHGPLLAAGAVPTAVNIETLLSAIERGPVAQLILDPAGRVALASAALRRLFPLTDADLGRPLKDLEISYRPTDLRSLLLEATAANDSVRLPDPVSWRGPNDIAYELQIEVTPLRDAQGTDFGTSITFLDTTRGAQLTSELERARQDADIAYEELQAMVEELETTNEELQSTNEELETTNEELQSTNEELQTTNEELQSTSDERLATNEQLETRTGELRRMNHRMDAILHAVDVAVAVVDRELRVELWNGRAKDLWGVAVDDVRGRHLLNLDIGLPVAELRDELLQCVNGSSDGSSTVLDARDRRGQELTCTVRCVPLLGEDGAPEGVIVLMGLA